MSDFSMLLGNLKAVTEQSKKVTENDHGPDSLGQLWMQVGTVTAVLQEMLRELTTEICSHCRREIDADVPNNNHKFNCPKGEPWRLKR